jgi:hypothetical protein
LVLEVGSEPAAAAITSRLEGTVCKAAISLSPRNNATESSCFQFADPDAPATVSPVCKYCLRNGAPACPSHSQAPTEAFLKCDAVKAAQLAALGPFREQYAHGAIPDIPQIIVVEGVRPPMHAFLCLGNVVAINSRYWDDIEDSCDVMRMCNLIMRVQQHGLYWASLQDYPIGTSDQHPVECVAGRGKIAVQQAGERVERAVWSGHLLKWWDPLSREETREHCNKLCVALRETGQLPQLSPGYTAKLVDSVRCVKPQRFQADDATTCFYVEEDEAWR